MKLEPTYHMEPKINADKRKFASRRWRAVVIPTDRPKPAGLRVILTHGFSCRYPDASFEQSIDDPFICRGFALHACWDLAEIFGLHAAVFEERLDKNGNVLAVRQITLIVPPAVLHAPHKDDRQGNLTKVVGPVERPKSRRTPRPAPLPEYRPEPFAPAPARSVSLARHRKRFVLA